MMGTYVRIVDRMNYRIGRIAMYVIFAMMAVLLWSSFTKVMPGVRPSLWTLEVAQFLMVAYYILGGPYSIQLDSNVRMDLIYGAFSLKRKAFIDCFTIFFLIVYLVFLLGGALNSFAYSLGHFTQETYSFLWGLLAAFFTGGPSGVGEEIGVLERSRSVWRPVLWPVKLVMITGITLMLLQSISELFKDIACWRTGDADPFGTSPIEKDIA